VGRASLNVQYLSVIVGCHLRREVIEFVKSHETHNPAFDLEAAIVVETPQLGHATYLFSKPVSLTEFLSTYSGLTKDQIRHNRNNAAERLGFLGRLIHGRNPQAWLQELRTRLGERIDYATSEA
jgi:hypothetical protein